MAIDIQTKRVYDPFESKDGFRVLVDRLWPRGLTSEQVKADLWLKEVAPSTELRKWFHQDMLNWGEFRQRYYDELDGNPEPITRLLDLAQNNRLTLLFSSREADRNHALALKEYLLARFEPNA